MPAKQKVIQNEDASTT